MKVFKYLASLLLVLCLCGSLVVMASASENCSHEHVTTTQNGCDWMTVCDDCGETVDSGTEHTIISKYQYYSNMYHNVTSYCTVCKSNVGSVGREAHNPVYGEWEVYGAYQHRRTKNCANCTYGSYDYYVHSDEDGDGICDTCLYVLSVTITWDLGDGTTLTTTQSRGKALVLPEEPTRENHQFSGWYTADGTEVTGDTVFNGSEATTYYAQWVQMFSVTVPASLPLAMDENGAVYCSAAEIVNNSIGAVAVTSVTLQAENGWTLVPYSTEMAHEKVDANLVGFSINGAASTRIGQEENLVLDGDWTIPQGGTLPFAYDAVISAVSQAVTEEVILSVIFIVKWS